MVVTFSSLASHKHILHEIAAEGAPQFNSMALSLQPALLPAARLLLLIAMNPPPLAKFNEYLDPFAANDKMLEHREHVAMD